jgi:hypothetical protein
MSAVNASGSYPRPAASTDTGTAKETLQELSERWGPTYTAFFNQLCAQATDNAASTQTAPKISSETLFSRAKETTDSSYEGDPLAAGITPEDIVMGTIANFAGDANISDYERGALLHLVIEMKSSGNISRDEAYFFANRVENLTRGLDNFMEP